MTDTVHLIKNPYLWNATFFSGSYPPKPHGHSPRKREELWVRRLSEAIQNSKDFGNFSILRFYIKSLIFKICFVNCYLLMVFDQSQYSVSWHSELIKHNLDFPKQNSTLICKTSFLLIKPNHRSLAFFILLVISYFLTL